MKPVQLGDRVRDRMTGFSGIAIAITEWLYNCRRITVQPTELDKDGSVAKTESFDEDQVEVIKSGAFEVKVQEKEEVTPKTGGPRPTPTRRGEK